MWGKHLSVLHKKLNEKNAGNDENPYELPVESQPLHKQVIYDILTERTEILQELDGRMPRETVGAREPPSTSFRNETGLYEKLSTKNRAEFYELGPVSNSAMTNDEPKPFKRSLPHRTNRPKVGLYENIIVHFDLKGAAPKVHYFKDILKLIKSNGATGVLIEWEDMFPFTGILEENRNTMAYTHHEVHEILSTAKSLNLDIIPLVQTFGHLEWILKLEKYRKFRENDEFPQVVCLADSEGVDLVKEAIKQVITLHKQYGIKYFHIGADEAFEFGVCEKDEEWMRKLNVKETEVLAVLHIANITKYVKSLSASTKVLAWHDVLKTFKLELVESNGLSKLIEPVVWDYSETIQQQNEYTWSALGKLYRNVWSSSAYKGANSPDSHSIDIHHYLKNNLAWISQKKVNSKMFENWRGIILTGWQRYDHFAVLCELLPVGIPSLVVNLKVATSDRPESLSITNVLRETSISLHCTADLYVDIPESFNSCTFPGVELFSLIHGAMHHTLANLKEDVFDNYQIKGWFSRFNIRHNYTQLWYIEKLYFTVGYYEQELNRLEKMLRTELSRIFEEDAVDEWIFEYVSPHIEKVREYINTLEKLRRLKTFPVRTFKIKR